MSFNARRPDSSEQETDQLALREQLALLEAEARRIRSQLAERSPSSSTSPVRRTVGEQELFHAWLADAPAAISIMAGPEHRYQLSNRLNQEWTGNRIVLGKSVAELFPDAAQQGFVAMLDRVRETGEPVAGQETPFDVGGTLRFVNFIYQPLRDERGSVDAILGFVVDVTDQVLQRQRAESIARVAEALSEASSSGDVAGAVIEEVHDALGATATVVYFCDPGSGTAARLAAARGLPLDRIEALRGLPLDPTLPLGVAIGSGAPVFIEDRDALLTQYPAVAASSLPAEQLQAVAAIPLRQRGHTLGGIAVSFATSRSFDPAERGFLLSIAGHCALALERARFLESERRFRAVFDHALDAMVITADDRIFLDANPAACALLRASRASLIGRTVNDVVSEEPAVADLWSSFRQDGNQRGEVRLVRADGTTVDVEYSAAANILPGQHLAVWRDIEERKRAADTLRFLADVSSALGSTLDSEAALAEVARTAVPIMADWAVVDMLGDAGAIRRVHVAHVDPAKVGLAHELQAKLPTTIDDEAGVGKVIRTGVSELTPDITDELLRAYISDAELLDVLRSLGLASSMCVPLKLRGRTVGAITFVAAESRRRFGPADLTIAEEVARRASTAMENARSLRDAQEANRLKDEFLSTVSHELRTPLTAMLGWASLLLRSPKVGADPALRRGLETIARNAQAQGRLIEDVLDVSRIISGKLRLQQQMVDLGQVVSAALDVVTPMAAAKRVELHADVKPGVSIFGDADRLQQVVWNLLSNAVKFTPSGGRVGVSLARNDSDAVVRVTDTGQGIEAEVLPFVFDRFRQADSSSSRYHGGLGLGLAIARHLVELHGGVILAESPGRGSGATFTVRLPVRVSTVLAEEPTPEPDDEPSSIIVVRLDGVRVLVCEDDADTRELLAIMLRGAGAEVQTVVSASEALATLAASPPDVMVSDIGLPGEDGYGLMTRVRALPPEQGGRVPAIALTAYARAEDAEMATRAGFDLHVAKPVHETRLIRAIGKLAHTLRSRTGSPQ